MSELQRFFNPRTVVAIGGDWAANAIEQLQRSGFEGDIWSVHPTRETISGLECYRSVEDLPASPDAAFVGVNRALTIDVVAQLSALDCGGAICFASGFKESDQANLQQQLLDSAGTMPILGPNCYGFLNYLDNVCLWPDQHGGVPVSQGVGIIAQSSNISISLSMQRRSLPLACLFTLGNQAQMGVSRVANELIDDERVSVIGLYLEGFDDLHAFQHMADRARAVGKPIVVLKAGKTEKARVASLTHTASLAGSTAATSALFRRLGLVEVDSISVFIETLKLLDGVGPLTGPDVASVSCSGGEASLMSDMAAGTSINYRDFTAAQQRALSDVLGARVELANPLDYHTYIWGDVPTMTRCFTEVLQSEFDLTVFVLDLPRADRCSAAGYECAVAAILAARLASGAPVAVMAMLAENLDEAASQRFRQAGVVPLHDMRDGLLAVDAAIRAGRLRVGNRFESQPLLLSNAPQPTQPRVLTETESKHWLSSAGITVPDAMHRHNKSDFEHEAFEYPVVLKGQGLAHKSEAGAVVVGIKSEPELHRALQAMPECPNGYLVEAMVHDVVAELIVGINYDATGLGLLTIGSGGVLTELLQDSISVCLPCHRQELSDALQSLRAAPLLAGYRGQPAANIEALLDSIVAIADFAQHNHQQILELDINPLMVGSQRSVVADALIVCRP